MSTNAIRLAAGVAPQDDAAPLPVSPFHKGACGYQGHIDRAARKAAGLPLEASAPEAAPEADGEPEEAAPKLMSRSESIALERTHGPTYAAWEYYSRWLARHRWFVPNDERGDFELIPVFAREMERKAARPEYRALTQ